ncbi:MAG: hypothetical protein V1775_00235 [Bacteroidota bacterium]
MTLIKILEEKKIRIESATMGAEIALNRLGLIKDEISQREAFRLFSEAKVRSWIYQGLIGRVKTGNLNSKVTFSRIELNTIQSLEDKRKLK